MRVALSAEGTYPHQFGGVSVWCDQLIRALSAAMSSRSIALVATGTEPVSGSSRPRVAARDDPAVGPAPLDPLRARLSGGRGTRSPSELIDVLLDDDPGDRFGTVLRNLHRVRAGQEPTGRAGRRARGPAAGRRCGGNAGRKSGQATARRASPRTPAHPARRGHRHAAGRARAAPAVASPRAGRRDARGDQRPRRAARPGRQVAVPGADDRHRARRLHARAVPAPAQPAVRLAGEGPVPAVPRRVRARLPGSRSDHAGQRLQQALGGAARRGRGPGPHRLQRRRPRRLPGADRRARGADDLLGRPD